MTLTQPIRTSVAGPSGTRRLFAARDAGLAAHRDAFGPMPAAFDEGHLIAELEASGLSGRGGAGFPTWRKLMAAAAGASGAGAGRRAVPLGAVRKNAHGHGLPTASRRAGTGRGAPAPVVIANGAEGEPLSRKDATLLRAAPHLVLDGLLLAAATVRAGTVVLYVGAESLAVARRAIAERPDAAGVRLVEAPDHFLSGEASAVVRRVEGGPALPRDHAERLTTAGLGGAPTLVQNVETLAQVALIVRFGATWFRQVGTPGDPGTRLVSISGDLPEPGVLEMPGGVPLAQALRGAGLPVAGASEGVRAVLVGGYHGAWVPGEALATPLSREGLEPFGASPGAGILMALGQNRCGLEASAEIAAYLAGQSAKQCGPCANGLPRLADVLARLAARDRAAWLPGEVDRLARVVSGRGSCHHPDGTSRMVLSALTVFASDVQEHLAGRCEAHS